MFTRVRKLLGRLLRRDPPPLPVEPPPPPAPQLSVAPPSPPFDPASLWNPTGDPFDLRPDLASVPIEELVAAVLEMHRIMATPNSPLYRKQLQYFERLYSAALCVRSRSEGIETVVVDGRAYRIRPVGSGDVILTPADTAGPRPS